jgi:predicted nucleic acid-binding protein
MPYFTCDTSVLISRKLADFHKTPESFLMSAVVLMELMSGANDDSDRKLYEQAFHRYQKNNSLIVPTYDDWLTSYKILYFPNSRSKTDAKGTIAAIAARSCTASRAGRPHCR